MIRDLQAEIGTAKTPDLGSFGQTLRTELIRLDIKGKDAATVNDELTKCLDASKGGGSNACEYLNAKVEELHELRERRPKQNDPIAIIMGAIFAAIGVGLMIACSRAGTCGTPTTIAAAIVLFAAAALSFGAAAYSAAA